MTRGFGKVWLLAVGFGLTLPVLAQGAAAPAATYDIVTIKPHEAGDGSTSISVNDGIYRASNVSLKMLMEHAYDLDTTDQIVGLEGSPKSSRYDVQAKIDAETFAAMKGMSEKEREKVDREMMRAMLAERFQLKVHEETKDLPIFVLTLAKGGAKLKDADPAIKDGNMNTNNQNLTATAIGLEGLSSFLSERLHRKVEDKTGLLGKYDFTLQWAPDEVAAEGQKNAAGDVLPSLTTAVQEQLGLHLENAKGPVMTIVVDHVAEPSID